jgi:hypothetical protein
MEGITVDRVESMAQKLAAGLELEAAMREALARADFDAAIVLLLASAKAQKPFEARWLAEVLPLEESLVLFLALIGGARGDRTGVLLDLAERKRFGLDAIGLELTAAALWAAWKLEPNRTPSVRDRVIASLRTLARERLPEEAALIVSALARELADENLTALAEPWLKLGDGKRMVKELERYLAMRPVEAARAVTIDASPAAAGFTVRSGAQVGRNDPCPCGSGKKYKKCCQAKDEARGFSPSPIPGMTWEEYLVEGAAKMSADEVQKLDWPDLVRVALDKLQAEPLTVAMRRFAGIRRWELAERALELLARSKKKDAIDDLRNELIGTALADGDFERAQALADANEPRNLLLGDHAVLEIADGAGVDRLLEFCEEAVRDESGEKAIDLAIALCDHAPELGILIARGCLSSTRESDAKLLLQRLDDAGDRLGLRPDDPAWEIWDAITDARLERQVADAKESGERLKVAEETERLRQALKQASSRVNELERKVRAEPAAAQAAQVAIDPERERELRSKNAELKALIRESNEERRLLREKLATLSETLDDEKAAAPDDDDDEQEEELELEPARGVLIPRIGNRATDSLREHPPRIAGDALRRIGELCAGEQSAWSGVKQAKDMPRPLLMCRIGIHYRLLFRADEGVLDVIDLVTRESLDVALKRLRG